MGQFPDVQSFAAARQLLVYLHIADGSDLRPQTLILKAQIAWMT
jgi:hypothetical protein